jgi:hypothetical protein
MGKDARVERKKMIRGCLVGLLKFNRYCSIFFYLTINV